MKVFDVAFSEDLIFKKGDFYLTESTAQHIEHLVITQKGDYKYAPTLGASIREALSDEAGFLRVQGRIQETLEADGLNVKSLKLSEKLYIEAEYSEQ
jgi:hypothetical protein